MVMPAKASVCCVTWAFSVSFRYGMLFDEQYNVHETYVFVTKLNQIYVMSPLLGLHC